MASETRGQNSIRPSFTTPWPSRRKIKGPRFTRQAS